MDLGPGYKQTEVGAIPEDWDVRPLKRISPSQSVGLVVNPSTYFDDAGDVPILVGSNIRENSIVWESARRISEESNHLLTSSRLVQGDLVTVRVGEPGVTAVIPPELDGCNCASVMIVRQHFSFDSHWLCYVMNSRMGRSQVQHVQYGTAQKQFNISDAINFSYPVPPLAEQNAIAGALGDADALIESIEQLIAKKCHLKQGAMQKLLRPKYGWVFKKLGELASIQRGASPRPIESPIWFDDNSTIGWVRISDVTCAGMFLRETTQKLSPLGVRNSRPVSRGSLIMSICATVGRPIITEIDTCIHDGFVVFDALRVNQHFLYYTLKSIEKDWANRGQTGSQMNLNTALINRTEVATPRTEREQKEIVQVFLSMDAEIDALEARLVKARQIKRGMMHNLLTGKIRLI
jgi:type I restriction enzyme S subunit